MSLIGMRCKCCQLFLALVISGKNLDIFCLLNKPALISANDKYLLKQFHSLFSFIHVMFSYHNLILLQTSSNFIVKFISVFWCAKETTWFVSETDTEAILKQNVGDNSSQNVFFLMELGVWGLMGCSIFWQYQQGHGYLWWGSVASLNHVLRL